MQITVIDTSNGNTALFKLSKAIESKKVKVKLSDVPAFQRSDTRMSLVNIEYVVRSNACRLHVAD